MALPRQWGCVTDKPGSVRTPSRFLHRAGPSALVLLALLLVSGVVAQDFGAVPPGGPTSAVGSDHPTRVKILAHLEAVPGDHFRSIARCVHVSRAEARHHLNVLMRRGQVREARQGGRLRYYVNDPAQADRNAAFGAYWRLREPRNSVLRLVENRATVGPSDVAATLGISRQLASYHLQRLAASGKITYDGGCYRPAAAAPSGPSRARSAPSFVKG